MSYQIGQTVIRNFLAFDDAEFDFSSPGLTVVEGVIKGVAGCDSNGSGKSALIEAPVWALTGRTIRERCKGDDVIRIGSKGGCMVDVTIVGGDRKIRVVRYRADKQHGNKVFLYVNGEDISRGTSAQTDIAIEQELGLDYTTFLNTVAFGARSDVRSFFIATDADRKKIMDKLLGLEVYARAQSVAKGRIRQTQQKLDPLMDRHMNIGFAIEEKRKMVEELKAATTATVSVKEAEAALKKANAALAKAETRHESVASALDKAIAAKESSDRRLRKGYDVARANAEAKARELSDAQSSAKTKLQAVLRTLEGFTSLGSECPTCTQSVPKRLLSTLIAEASAERDLLKGEIAKAQRAIDAVVYPKQLKSDPDLVADVTNAEGLLEEANDELSDAKADVSSAKATLAALRDSEQRKDVSVKKVQGEIVSLQVELDENLDKQASLKAEIDTLEFWSQAFGNGGVKSFVIESELNTINQLATKFARRLLGAGTRVALAATKQLKSKDEEREEMVVEAAIPGCAQSYANASKGQKHRLDLSLILAFRAVVAARSVGSFAQLFADELFDGVDETGVECVVEILREISATCPVVLVTHDVRLKSVGDRRVVVVHDGTKARIA